MQHVPPKSVVHACKLTSSVLQVSVMLCEAVQQLEERAAAEQLSLAKAKAVAAAVAQKQHELQMETLKQELAMQEAQKQAEAAEAQRLAAERAEAQKKAAAATEARRQADAAAAQAELAGQAPAAVQAVEIPQQASPLTYVDQELSVLVMHAVLTCTRVQGWLRRASALSCHGSMRLVTTSAAAVSKQRVDLCCAGKLGSSQQHSRSRWQTGPW